MLRMLLVPALVLLAVVRATAQQNPDNHAKPLTMAQVWRLDATYTDKQHGVSFQYPSVWEAEISFGYNPPALTYSDEKPIAGFGYSGGPYKETNLDGFGIVYSAVPASSAAQCEAKAVSLSDKRASKQAMFGGRSFSVFETEDAGMSKSTSGGLYATYARSTCYLFETDVAVIAAAAEMDGIEPLTQAQIDDIESHLLGIMGSVRIAPEQ